MKWIQRDDGSLAHKQQMRYRQLMKEWYMFYFTRVGDEQKAYKAFGDAAVLLRQLTGAYLCKKHGIKDEDVVEEVFVYQLEKEKRRIEKRKAAGQDLKEAIEDGLTKAIFADIGFSYMTRFQSKKAKREEEELSYETMAPYMEVNEMDGWICENPEDRYIEQLTKEGL